MLSLERVQAAGSLQNLRKPELSGYTVFYTPERRQKLGCAFHTGSWPRRSCPTPPFPPRETSSYASPSSVKDWCGGITGWGEKLLNLQCFFCAEGRVRVIAFPCYSAGTEADQKATKRSSPLSSYGPRGNHLSPSRNPQTWGSWLTSTEEVWSGKWVFSFFHVEILSGNFGQVA